MIDIIGIEVFELVKKERKEQKSKMLRPRRQHEDGAGEWLSLSRERNGKNR